MTTMSEEENIKYILGSVPYYSMNPFINKCPSCGSIMNIEGEFIREDSRRRTKLVERSLKCPHCKVSIRQQIYIY